MSKLQRLKTLFTDWASREPAAAPKAVSTVQEPDFEQVDYIADYYAANPGMALKPRMDSPDRSFDLVMRCTVLAITAHRQKDGLWQMEASATGEMETAMRKNSDTPNFYSAGGSIFSEEIEPFVAILAANGFEKSIETAGLFRTVRYQKPCASHEQMFESFKRLGHDLTYKEKALSLEDTSFGQGRCGWTVTQARDLYRETIHRDERQGYSTGKPKVAL